MESLEALVKNLGSTIRLLGLVHAQPLLTMRPISRAAWEVESARMTLDIRRYLGNRLLTSRFYDDFVLPKNPWWKFWRRW